MPQVPYSGVPDVAPQDSPIPRYRADAPTAAFGGATAQALGMLGRSFSDAGNELFTRAMAMQDLANHSEAQEATSQYMEQAGKLHADYSALQGKDAVNGYDDYVKNLQSARTSVRDGLSNPMVQKMYDADSRSFEARTIFNGAGHAATENKQYAIGAAAARVSTARSAALLDPTDEQGFQAHVADTERNTRAQWQLKGADDDTISAATHKAVSDLWYDRIAGLARTQPFTAQKFLDSATKDGKLEGEDIGKLTNIVQSATHTTGARQISSGLTNGDISWGAKPVSISAAKVAIGTYESSNNYQAKGVEVAANADHPSGIALGKYQIMSYNLSPWLKEAGMPDMTPAEFLSSPKAQDNLFEFKFGQLMEKRGSFNGAAGDWLGHGKQGDPNGTTIPKYVAATNAILAQNAPLADKVARGRTVATAQAPNDPLLADYTEQRVIQDHNQAMAVKRDDQFQTRQTLDGGLIQGDQQGKLPTTVDQLIHQSPQIEAAWQSASPEEKMRVQNILSRNSKGDQTWDPEGKKLQEYNTLRGLAVSDPAAFMGKDLASLDMPNSAKLSLINLRAQLQKNADADPRVLHALSILKPTLDTAGISRQQDKDGYDHFVGSLQSAMEQFQNDNKSPPKAKDIQEIGQRLLQAKAGTGWFGSSIGAEKLYNVEVPDEEKTKIVSDPYWKSKGTIPTDDMIHRIYVQQLYNQLYGGTPKSQEATK